MIRESLFAAEEREAKLDKLGDILQILDKLEAVFDSGNSSRDLYAEKAIGTKNGKPV